MPRSSGIYRIRCKRNGKIYVGSAADLRARWKQHVTALRAGRHINPHLQSAWRWYGDAAFEFEILEHVEAALLLEAEQHWIDKTGCTDRRLGFNVRAQATAAGQGIG